MKKKNYIVNIMIVIVIVLPFFHCRASCGSRVARKAIRFEGTATGGTLLLGDAKSPFFVRYYGINTTTGESAESVVKRMAETIASSDTLIHFGSSRGVSEIASDMISGNTLIIPGGMDWCLSGTETGLGIPKAPLFLSCTYNEITDELEVTWENQEGVSPNDIICIRWRYTDKSGVEMGGSEFIHGTSASYTIDGLTDPGLIYVWLMVRRYDTPADVLLDKGTISDDSAIPSNITAIAVTDDGYCQQEIEGIPFTGGVTPNWAVWGTDAKISEAAFEQYERTTEMRYDGSSSRSILESKPFYQIINAPAKGAAHGLYRKFLGLTPGHTYRLTACISTLEMDSVKRDWSFSMHAVPNSPGSKNLTAQQMAGIVSLPNGQRGSEAGQIVSYGPGKTTKGSFNLAITGDTKLEGRLISSDITLPADVNEITIWLRFNCEDPKGKVGFSGVRLEDITMSQSTKSRE